MILGYQGETMVNSVVVHLLIQRMVLRPHVEGRVNGLLLRPVHTLHFFDKNFVCCM
jgi:hypothetical protein